MQRNTPQSSPAQPRKARRTIKSNGPLLPGASDLEHLERPLADFLLFSRVLRDLQHRVRTPLMIIQTICTTPLQSSSELRPAAPSGVDAALMFQDRVNARIREREELERQDLAASASELHSAFEELRWFEIPSNGTWHFLTAAELAEQLECTIGPHAISNLQTVAHTGLLRSAVSAFEQALTQDTIELQSVVIQTPIPTKTRPPRSARTQLLLPYTGAPISEDWLPQSRGALLLSDFAFRLASLAGASLRCYQGASDSATLEIRVSELTEAVSE